MKQLTTTLRLCTLLVIALTILVAAGCGVNQAKQNNSQGSAGNSATNTEATKETQPPAVTAAPEDKEPELLGSDQHPEVTIETSSGGIIKVELYPEVAPNTVNNFIALVDQGFYDGVIFHRVMPGFMIQGGDPDGTGMGGPGYSIPGEFTNNGLENNLKHDRGVISMARSTMPDSAGSQFFIMVDEAPHLDGDYAAFGKVIEGMEAVDEIVNQDRDGQDKPLEPISMKKVTVDKKGMTFEEPKKTS
ncbi:peptidylprolyl isomerase [Paenibacillus sp. J5C_2022]|uniref:peptidylprolyl isomerase n=1 Tax=Paenibacillus sp. J5C2022 TaxID=2977129 RepID=UPI0021CE0527|nr:peptidylprolyl isomerase [Paenibacillus sp. J5C2022]MCU6712246.1 peptidylprolyl isomerase [Paenibacillus sp. J5C2022]